jgi:hypothetical protein
MKQAVIVSLISMVLVACSGGAGSNAQLQKSGDAAVEEAGAGDDGSSSSADAPQGSSAIEYDATLSGAEVVPPVLTASAGTAKFYLQADGMTLTYDITLSVPNATAVDLHLAAPGENGAVTHPLTPISNHMTGSVTLTSNEQMDITSDMLYVDVQTPANPGGEVRGQLMPVGATLFVANATAGQELPATTSLATGHGSFVLSADGTTVVYHIATTATATDVRLQRAIGGLVGPVSDDISPVSQTMDGTLQISATDPMDLQAGHVYLNIVTAANQAGELRGQLIPPGTKLFTGVLSGGAESPPTASTATGGAQVVLNAAQNSIAYEVVVAGVIPTSAELDNAAPKQNGPLLYLLTLGGSGAVGTTAVTASDVTALLAGNVYVNVKTASYGMGELRAQLAGM